MLTITPKSEVQRDINPYLVLSSVKSHRFDNRPPSPDKGDLYLWRIDNGEIETEVLSDPCIHRLSGCTGVNCGWVGLGTG